MRKLTFLLVTFILVLGISKQATACGDKFLVIGRGLRFERAYAAKNPGTILLYRDGNDDSAKTVDDLQKALTKAGHKVQTVDSADALTATLKTSKFDLVVLNLNDVTVMEQEIITSPSKPAVLPIIYNKTGNELANAGKQYDCILKASGKNTDALKVVDEAIAERKKGQPIKCKWSK